MSSFSRIYHLGSESIFDFDVFLHHVSLSLRTLHIGISKQGWVATEDGFSLSPSDFSPPIPSTVSNFWEHRSRTAWGS
jgi:hypothetical protein